MKKSVATNNSEQKGDTSKLFNKKDNFDSFKTKGSDSARNSSEFRHAQKLKISDSKKSALISAISIISGTAIGAGILGLPYVISKVGLVWGILEIIILGLLMLLINLYVGEISVRTKGDHQLTGYAKIYLGEKGKKIMLISMIFSLYAALIAYILAEGELLSYVFFGSVKYSFLASLGFWFIMLILITCSIKTMGKGENIGIIAILLLVGLIAIFFLPQSKPENFILSSGNNFLFNLFFPYGLILFALTSFSALPLVEQRLHGKERLMKKAIIISAIIPIIVYLLFTISIIGFKGTNVPEIGVIGLGKIPALFGVFTIFTAFFSLAYALKSMYEFDFKIDKINAWLLTIIIPLIMFWIISYLKLTSFVKILGISGSITIALIGIMILLMNKKAKMKGNRKPEYSIRINWFIIILLGALFILGAIFEIYFNIFK